MNAFDIWQALGSPQADEITVLLSLTLPPILSHLKKPFVVNIDIHRYYSIRHLASPGFPQAAEITALLSPTLPPILSYLKKMTIT